MKVDRTRVLDVLAVIPQRFGDERGFFCESYSKRRFEEIGLSFDFVQDNYSISQKAGTVRGLHFQAPPHAQTKLVRCVRGRVLDVVVDVPPEVLDPPEVVLPPDVLVVVVEPPDVDEPPEVDDP